LRLGKSSSSVGGLEESPITHKLEIVFVRSESQSDEH
jgi:hypothetical protein